LRLDSPAFERWIQDDLARRFATIRDQFHVPEYALAEALDSFPVEGAPSDPARRGLLALALVERDRVDEAEPLLGGDSPEQLLARARLAALRHSNEQAISILDQLLAAGGDGYDARLLRAELEAARGDTAAASWNLRLASSWNPDEALPLYRLSELFDHSLPETVSLLKDALRRGEGPRTLRRLHEMSQILDDGEVEWIAERGILLAPYDPLVHDFMAEVKRRRGDRAASDSELELARALRQK
jgi:hypothetical protein